MDTSFRFLRDWLPFAGKAPEGQSEAELAAWLDGLRELPAETVADELTRALPGLLAGETDPPPRMKRLDALFAVALRVVPLLENEVHASPLPLPPPVRLKALAADNLLKALAGAYGSVIDAIVKLRHPGRSRRLLRPAIAAAIGLLARRQQLAYRAYSPASENAWRLMHRYYRIARDRDFADAGGEDERIDHLYIGALLLSVSDPARFPRETVGPLAAACRHLASSARVVEIGNTSADSSIFGHTRLYVDAGAGRPGRLRSPGASATACSDLELDLGGAMARLQLVISAGGREGQAAPHPLQVVSGILPELLSAWEGATNRRFARQSFKPRVDLVAGIENLSRFAARSGFGRRQNDPEAHTAKLAVSEWSVIDESPDGFGVRYVNGQIPSFEVGEVVGLHRRDHAGLHVCLVRRISNHGAARFELGLCVLSPDARPLPRRDAAGAAVAAVLLPVLPAHGGDPGVLAAPGVFRPGETLSIPGKSGPESRVVGELIDGNGWRELYRLTAP